MKEKIVKVKASDLPPLTPEAKARLAELANRPDSEIDVSDIPEMTDEQWESAVRRRLYRPVKQQITARIDADVLEWLKSKGAGYQSRMNDILRTKMLEEMKG